MNIQSLSGAMPQTLANSTYQPQPLKPQSSGAQTSAPELPPEMQVDQANRSEAGSDTLKNRMIFGGRAAFFPENKNMIARSADILRREMIRVYPQLRDVKIDYVWGGTLDFAFDMMTHVGEVDGVYYSLGYAGHGVAMASHLGKTVAEAMLNANIKEHSFAQFDFPNAPLGLYDGFPWFLPFAGRMAKGFGLGRVNGGVIIEDTAKGIAISNVQ